MLTTTRESETQAITMTDVQFGPPTSMFLADRFNRGRVIISSLFLWSLTTRFTSRATGFGLLNFFSCAVGGFVIYAGRTLRDAHVRVTFIFVTAAAGLRVCAALLSLITPRSLPRLTES